MINTTTRLDEDAGCRSYSIQYVLLSEALLLYLKRGEIHTEICIGDIDGTPTALPNGVKNCCGKQAGLACSRLLGAGNRIKCALVFPPFGSTALRGCPWF